MRTAAQIQEKIEHLLHYKKEVIFQFQLIDMSVKKHAVLAAYYRTIDNEISMLRWVLGQVEQTWSDDLSNSIDIEDGFDNLPSTEFPHLPYGQRCSSYWSEEVVGPGPYINGPDSPTDDDPTSQWANEGADRPLLWS
jgi:hypothetical protein